MIRAPKWAKGAYPTTRGWVRDGELLKSQKISQSDVDAWGKEEVAVPAAPRSVEPKPEMVDIDNLNKAELEEFAREEGIELDRRRSLKNMMKDYLSLKG